ncbi:hypothetical protein IQ268_22455 [Oculatella sp. LEGE 06141]|uniref:hypothetical protein n=1 Tax=Oculatella sp. LEGE 06141 TaxID=1828648 RepID=UPI00187F3B0F|nr:hypothetical protein [Oculatella sp. LEGE 06141]MBE9181327.1 hypothetical protein [Oculatella sp. LEGE 06141]
MSTDGKQQVGSIRPLWAGVLSTLLLVGCTSGSVIPPSSDLNQKSSELNDAASSSPSEVVQTDTQAPAEQQDWRTLLPTQAVDGLTFTADGELAYGDEVLLSEIPVSYSSDDTVTYAKRLIVSPSSPSGAFRFVKACEAEGSEDGLCWSVYLVNTREATAEKVDIGKYGGSAWVQWTADERYAVLVEQHDGATWFVVVDLAAGESQLSEELPPNVEISSFEWIDDRTFHVDFRDCTTAECDFTGNVEDIFSANSY